MLRRTAFTGRAAVLALVVCALALTLAYPIQRYVQQQREIADLRAEVGGGKAKVQSLRQEKARWADPAYVRQRARERLHYVMPGETGYVVIGADNAREPGRDIRASAESTQHWYDKLWGSVVAADGAPRGRQGKQPATHIGPGEVGPGAPGKR